MELQSVMPATKRWIAIVEASPEAKAACMSVVQQNGLTAQSFDTAEKLLQHLKHRREPEQVAVVLDFQLADMTGLALQDELNESWHSVATVFFAADPRVKDVVRAMRSGAITVVEKSEGAASLIPYLEEALERVRVDYEQQKEQAETASQLKQLNEGERDVLQGILTGKLNKEIAQQLNLSIRTIEQRRRELFRKLGVQHPAPLACKIMQLETSRRTRFDTPAERSLLDQLRDNGAPAAHFAKLSAEKQSP